MSQMVGFGLAVTLAWHVYNMHEDWRTSALVVLMYAFGVAKGAELRDAREKGRP